MFIQSGNSFLLLRKIDTNLYKYNPIYNPHNARIPITDPTIIPVLSAKKQTQQLKITQLQSNNTAPIE